HPSLRRRVGTRRKAVSSFSFLVSRKSFTTEARRTRRTAKVPRLAANTHPNTFGWGTRLLLRKCRSSMTTSCTGAPSYSRANKICKLGIAGAAHGVGCGCAAEIIQGGAAAEDAL